MLTGSIHGAVSKKYNRSYLSMNGIEKVDGGYKFSDESVFRLVDHVASIRTEVAQIKKDRETDKAEAKEARKNDNEAIKNMITNLPIEIREGCPVFRLTAGTKHEPDSERIHKVNEFKRDQAFLRKARKSSKYIGAVFGAGFAFIARQKIVTLFTAIGDFFKK